MVKEHDIISIMAKLVLALGVALISCSVLANPTGNEKCTPSITRSSTLNKQLCKGDIIFEDNFDSLDLNKWSYEVTLGGGGNWEFQVYWEDPINSFTSNGNLHLNPGKLADIYGEEFLWTGTIDLGDRCTNDMWYGCYREGTSENYLNPATSARLHTVNTFSFVYGTVEVRAKMPAGDWLWPAIWMMPRDSRYGGWPMSGEIDIMECRGNRDLVEGGRNIGTELAGSTMHWGADPFSNQYWRTHWERNTAPGQGYNNDFHLYQLEWTPDYIKFSLDNVEMGTVAPPPGGFYELGEFANQGIPNPWTGGSKMAPFDAEFYLILNLAVGGTNGWFPDTASNPGGKPWSNQSPVAPKEFWDGRAQWEPTWRNDGSTNMEVDYVVVRAL